MSPSSDSTCVLSDSTSQSRLIIAPERGGIVTSWQVKGQEIFYLDQDRFADPSLSVRGGIPILFPICGNLPSDRYTYDHQTYNLKQHGFARDLAWEVREQTATSASLALSSSEATLRCYPFEFDIIFSYRLVGHRLEIHQHFHNRGAGYMPFSVGLHPYFQTQDKSRLQLEIPAGQGWDQKHQLAIALEDAFDFNRDEIDLAFRPVTRQEARVTDPSRNLQITIGYDQPYSTLVFWTLKGKDFYCLEPWSAPRNALNTGEDLTHLAPGSSLETSVTLSVSPIPI